ncbi:DNA-directed DNA polymerase [Tanacetum coccineum]
MTRSTIKKLTKPLDEPEREFGRLRRAASRSHQTDSLAITGRNLFKDEASSSNNTEPKPPTPPKTLHEHSRLTSSGFQNPITIPTEQTGRIVDSRDIWLIQNTCTFQGLRTEDPRRHVKHYLSIVDNIQADGATRDTSRSNAGSPTNSLNSASAPSLKKRDGIELKTMQPTLRGRLKRACKQISFLETPTQEVGIKNPYLICNYCGGSHEANECELNNPSEQVCLSRGDIYNDPSLLRFYQNDDTSPWGNNKRKKKGEDIPKWTVRSKFEDELTNFMLEKKLHTKGIGDMLVQHRISTRDLPFPTPPRLATNNFIEGETKKEKPEGTEKSTTQEPVPRSSILYQPLKISNPPFPSRLKKQKKEDEDERLLSIFKQIHINLPFLEAMIHMPKGAKVLKDLLSHKEKLEKAASSIKLSEECPAIIQRRLPQKEGGTGSFTLPCLIGPLIIKNTLANLGASINLMPHSLFQRLGISKLKPTKMSIQLADRSIKYPIKVRENLLVKVGKFIFPVDFVILEMDEDELVPIILR